MTTDWLLLYVATLSLTVVTSSALFIMSWRRRRFSGAYALMGLSVALLIWALAEALEGVVNDRASMITISKLSYLGIAPVPPLWMMFAIQRVGVTDGFSRRWYALLALPVLVTLALVFTNDWHGFIWAQLPVIQVGNFEMLAPAYGPAFWVFVTYAYTMVFVATFLLARVGLRSLRHRRTWAIVLIISVLIPSANSILHLLKLPPVAELDFTPLVFSISALIVGWLLMSHYSLQHLPVAHRTIIENMTDGVLVLDLSGYVIDTNSAAARLLGVPHDTMSGQRLISLLIDHPEVRQLYEELTSASGGQRHDETLLGRDKVETFVELSVLDLSSRDGQTVGQVVVIRDITDRKQAQIQAARRMAELTALRHVDQLISSTLDVDSVLETALDSALRMSGADAGFISLSEDNHQVIVHTSDGYPLPLVGKHLSTAEGVAGRVMQKQTPELVYDVLTDPDYTADRSTTRAQMTVPLLAHDRLVGVLNLEADDPQHFHEGAYEFVRLLAGRIAAAVDNARLYTMTQSQLKKLEALYVQVSELEKLKTDMIRLASHDLRNPLGTMIMCLDLMESEQEQLTPEHRTYLDTLIRLASQMERLVVDILSSERYQEAAMRERVDLQGLVGRVLVEHADRARSRFQLLKADIPAEPIYVLGDEAQLREASANLIGNAIKYTPEGGRITVRLKANNGIVAFQVTDTGYGIPEDMQPHLFQPFYRAISEQTQQIDGTGLGLSLVKNIIERHQGRVHFESIYGQGSTFGFDLPVAEAETPAPSMNR